MTLNEVGDAGSAGPGLDERLQPAGGDHAGAHVNPGARIDKGLIAFDHHGLVEGHRGDRGGHARDEVDAVLLRPALKNPPVGSFRDVLHREMADGVVADRIDGDPVGLVELGVVIRKARRIIA